MRKKLYNQTWFICLMFALWFLIIPCIIGIILLVKQKDKEKSIIAFYGEIDQLQDKIDALTARKANLDQEFDKKKSELELEFNDKSTKLDQEFNDKNTKLDQEFNSAKVELEQNFVEAKKVIESNLTVENEKLLSDFEKGKSFYEKRKKDILNEVAELRKEIKSLKTEILELTHETYEKAYNFTDYENLTSEECKNRIAMLKTKEQNYIKDDKAISIKSLGSKKEITNNIKQLLRCFNAECDNTLLNLSVRNIDTQRNKIQKSFETLNKIFDTDGISLQSDMLGIKLEMLNLAYTYELKKDLEREQQKAIREQMLEEEKVRREIEKEKQKIEKEESQFKGELSKLMDYMRKTDNDIEKNIYIDKIKELEEKLKLVEKDKDNVLEREQNTRAGFVYIISNIGSFGEDVYKIGMTRRLEPMDRINELSSASVPFRFDVHAMIFSADAPALETTLHQRFRKYEVNKVNPRKEFFKIDLKEIEKVVKENHNATVEFTLLAKATEYRASIEQVAKQ